MKVTRIDWALLGISAALLTLLIISSFYGEVPTPLFVIFLVILAVGVGLSVVKHLAKRRRRQRGDSAGENSSK